MNIRTTNSGGAAAMIVVAACVAWPARADDKPLSPVLERAIVEKEKEVVAARHEAIGLLEAYLRDSGHSREQAEALYKLAELYWEDSKVSYLDRMGRYQAAVSACHADRAECP